MNEYRFRSTGQIVTEHEFRAMFPHKTFALVISKEDTDDAEADPLLSSPAPYVTGTQIALRDGAVQDSRGNWVYAWRIESLPDEVIAANAEQAAKAVREAAKVQRAIAVANIKVTTAAGNLFDGDETSQGRMARAIIALQANPNVLTVKWVLASNTVIDASAAELTEALALAGAAQAAVWVL